MFVPYYRHLLDPLLAALDEPVAPVRKKRKKAKAAETPVPATGSAATEADWHRRVQVCWCASSLRHEIAPLPVVALDHQEKPAAGKPSIYAFAPVRAQPCMAA